jgi:hypothetical protein
MGSTLAREAVNVEEEVTPVQVKIAAKVRDG